MPAVAEGQVDRLLREHIGASGLLLPVIQKDYAISYVLAGISDVPDIYEKLMFKGGTCLRKAYFRDYRFSDDLDYTLLGSLECEMIGSLLEQAAARASERLNERGPFALEVGKATHRGPHERGQCEFKIRVQFPSMRAAQCVLKVEILPSPPELVAGQPVEAKLIHGFDEELEVRIRCYQLEEITAEKLRGFLQTRARFDDVRRSWVRTRPRDLFDLSWLKRQKEYSITTATVRRFLERKCPPYGLTFDGPDDFLDSRVLDGMRRDWDGSLGPFVRGLPSFEDCLADYRALLAEVIGR